MRAWELSIGGWHVVFAIWSALVSATIHLASGAGYIAFPPAQYLEPRLSPPRDPRIATKRLSRAFRGPTGDDLSDPTIDQLTDAATQSDPESSLRLLIDESIPDCGNSRIDVAPVDVTHAPMFKWEQTQQMDSADQGPCEIWLDNVLVYKQTECSKVFPGAIQVDYSTCQGKCVVTFYWLVASGTKWTALKHCVPIRFEDDDASESGSNTGSDRSASKEGSRGRDGGSGSLDDDDMQSRSQDGSLDSERASSRGSSRGFSSSSSFTASSGISASSSSSSSAGRVRCQPRSGDLQTINAFQDAVYGVDRSKYVGVYENGLGSMRKHPAAHRRRARLHHYSPTYTKSETRTCTFTGASFTCSTTEEVAMSRYVDE